MNERSGFTLLEVLTAVLLFGVLILSVAGLWNVCWKVLGKLDHGDYSESKVSIFLRRFDEAVEASLYHKTPKGVYAWKSTKNFGVQDCDEVSFVTTMALDSVVRNSELAAPERIWLYTKEDDHRRKSLMMKVAPFTMEENHWEREIELFSDLKAFRLRFWSYEEKRWLDNWSDEEHPPLAVQISVALKGDPTPQDLQSWRFTWISRTRT